ncbi:MAG: DUF4166 domain-containing protein [Hyphomonadaceae bacterium]|nr:DUF4166 domain-containing protein [Hyphomonadaceae bacterium]
MTRLLIVGGAGVFGRRLAEGLIATTPAHVIIAGRSLSRAEAAAKALAAAGAAALDRDTSDAAAIAAHAPDIVVDAAGPFQNGDLRFARAVLEAGAHYLDLADARGFAAAFPTLDALAKRCGRVAITGASSTPALTHAVLDHVCAGWRAVDRVHAGIAPGARAPRGDSLVRAILSWVGQPLAVWQGGAWRTRRGWSHCRTVRVAGLGPRRFALAETPDLDLIPARFAVRDTAWFMAALESAPMHRGLEAVSALRAVWAAPEKVAGLMRRAGDVLCVVGSDIGAMFVEASGLDSAGDRVRVRWRMIAPPGLGPFTPTLPALVLLRRMMQGEQLALGAKVCVGVVTLAELEPELQRLGMTARIERTRLRSAFQVALGADYTRLPAAVRAVHDGASGSRFSGRATVQGSRSGAARLVARVFGLPVPGADAPVTVTMRHEADGMEVWERVFNGRHMRSRLRALGPGRVRESFGPFSFDLAISVREDALEMAVEAWRLGPFLLPRVLAPRSDASERQDAAGRFRFDVPIAVPGVGQITHYSGFLTPESVEQSAPAALTAAS